MLLRDRIQDYLRWDDVSVQSLDKTVIDGKEVVAIDTRWTWSDETGEGLARIILYFDPETWIFQGFTQYPWADDPKAGYFHHLLNYEPGSAWPPRLSRLEIFTEDASRPGLKRNRTVYEIDSLEFGEIDLQEFTLAAFDTKYPHLEMSPTFRWSGWISPVLARSSPGRSLHANGGRGLTGRAIARTASRRLAAKQVGNLYVLHFGCVAAGARAALVASCIDSNAAR